MRRAIALLAFSLACGGSRPVEQPASPPAAPPGLLAGTEAAPGTLSPVASGTISEADFMALHVLKEGGVPALRGEMVELADGSQAYRSSPPGADARTPAVLVVHESWGLNDHIKHSADRLAAEGYVALAVDLYGGDVVTDAAAAISRMKLVDDAAATATLLAGVQTLRTPEDRKIGVVGWCLGGGWSLRTALATPDLDAAVMYYGEIETDPVALSALQAPLVGIFASHDPAISAEDVDAFEAALDAAGKDAAIHRYDAQHAFANPSNAHYDQAKAGEAWETVRGFLGEQLGG